MKKFCKIIRFRDRDDYNCSNVQMYFIEEEKFLLAWKILKHLNDCSLDGLTVRQVIDGLSEDECLTLVDYSEDGVLYKTHEFTNVREIPEDLIDQSVVTIYDSNIKDIVYMPVGNTDCFFDMIEYVMEKKGITLVPKSDALVRGEDLDGNVLLY